MTLLAPAALFGMLLLALPVLIHLLRPRKLQPTPFSSLRWLKVTRQRLSRRIQWHQWLLFLLRAGLVVLLVLALAKPIAGLWGSHGATDRFIVVDGGRVMEYAAPDRPTPFAQAQEIAARLAEHGQPGARTTVLLAGGPPKLLAPPGVDPSAALPRLRSAAVQQTDARVSSAFTLLPALVGREPQRPVELYVVTANQRAGWQQGEVQALATALGDKLHAQLIDVGPGTAPNAWIAGARLIDRGGGEDLVLRALVGYTGGASDSRSVRLTGIADLGDAVRDVPLTPGQLAHVDFVIPASVSLAGQVAELRLEPEDALPSDDRYYLNLDMAWALRILLIEPPTDAPEQPGPGLHLRTALDALAASGNHSFRLTSRTSASVTPADVHAADIVVLAGVPKLAADVTAGLEQRVRNGAGLLVFLGPQLDGAFYSQQLYRPVQPETGLLPFALRTGKQSIKDGRPDELRQLQWSHPVLAPLRDPLLGELGQCKFLRYAALDGTPGKGDAVLARFEDDTPALVDRSLGAGRVLFWNTTIDDAWSNLPRRPCFVPLVDLTLSYLSAGGVRRQFVVGEPINLPVVGLQSGDEVRVTGPDGATLPVRVQTAGSQAVLHFDAISRPGTYRVAPGAASKAWAFAVNTSRDASPLTPMDAEALQSWWSPAACEVVDGDTALARLQAESSGWSLWPALVLLGGLLLLAETIYVYRLCPQRNPTVVASVVPQRGILRPIDQAGPH